MAPQADLAMQSTNAATGPKLQVAIFVCPGYVPVDIVGLHAIFGFLPDAEVHLVWKDKGLILGQPAFPTHATTTFAECPRDLDILLVGAVPPEILEDAESLAFLADRGARARWVAGVCAGSLVLGAAGLLQGYRATSNFHLIDALAPLGATPVRGGLVEDRNRLTSGPATGGFEIGLRLLGYLRGDELAREMELQIEYDPHAPYGTGSPERAGPALVARALQSGQPLSGPMYAAALRAAERLSGQAPSQAQSQAPAAS